MNVHAHNELFCLTCEIALIAPLLPRQAPIKDFIHQNILQVFIDRPFDDALKHGAHIFKAQAYMDLAFYRQNFTHGTISDRSLKAAIKDNFGSLLERDLQVLDHALFHYFEIFDRKTYSYLIGRKSFPRDRHARAVEIVGAATDTNLKKPSILQHLLNERLNCKLDHFINALLFRLIGSYIDQGVSLWPYLDRFDDFLEAVRHLASLSGIRLASYVKNSEFIHDISGSYNTSACNLLKNMFADPALYKDYLSESLLHHPGWSGMVNIIAKNPASLPKKKHIDLESLFIVKTALEWQFIKHTLSSFEPINQDDAVSVTPHEDSQNYCLSLIYFLATLPNHLSFPSDALIHALTSISLQKTWADALEGTYYDSVRSTFSLAGVRALENGPPKFQSIFCIDDREFAFARHLENESNDVLAYGFPGFFNIDCFFRPYPNQDVEKLCPANVHPKHLVIEQIKEKKKHRARNPLLELASYIVRHGANSIFFGFLSAFTFGHLSLFRLGLSFLHPIKMIEAKQLSLQEEFTTLVFEHKDESSHHQDLVIGFTTEELAQRLFSTLNSMGLTKAFAKVIFVFGHGSSSVNNPHFAAYDCGACSGKPGNVNARVFATMANNQDVRARVKDMGIAIPDDSIFVGGYHDTATDRIEFFDLDRLPKKAAPFIEEFSAHIFKACAKNAYERCQAFALADPSISLNNALRETEHRARALFEPRPELGHMNASLCIIGRKHLVYKRDFKRRAFYQSYDPSIDHNGQILSSVLSAAIPVCGGINLDYYFGRLAPAIYGCGTKLSHNVCSLVGVGNGLDDDLRTGLPIQMTELHDPIRLLIVIEQNEEVILAAIHAQPELIPWVKNGWVKIGSINDPHNRMTIYDPKCGSFTV